MMRSAPRSAAAMTPEQPEKPEESLQLKRSYNGEYETNNIKEIHSDEDE